MTIKVNGAEFKRFYQDRSFWPNADEYYHEDAVIKVNGVEDEGGVDVSEILDTDVVTLEGGYVYGPKNGPSLAAYFRTWKRKQTCVLFNVECDVSKAEEIMAVIRGLGGRVR